MLCAYSNDEDVNLGAGAHGTREGRARARESERDRGQRTKTKQKQIRQSQVRRSLGLGPDPEWPVGDLPPKNASLIQGGRTEGASGARRRKSLDLTQWPGLGSTLGGSPRHQRGSLIQRESELGERAKPRCSGRRISRRGQIRPPHGK